ncbi:MAG: hypothetical protein KDJ77_08615 [Rhodobiaceae bacterium]|nr:hypothetical protein [Rhodobiaceae bacterium]
MQHDDDLGRSQPPGAWRVGRGHDESHAFIVRVSLSIAADGQRRPHFSLEDIAAGSTDRFASFTHLADRLARRVEAIIQGPFGDTARQ